MREEAGTEVGVTGTVSVADWVRGLAPETRRRLIVRLGAAVAATIGLAGHALEQRNVLLAGAMLALATTLYAIYVEAKDVAE